MSEHLTISKKKSVFLIMLMIIVSVCFLAGAHPTTAHAASKATIRLNTTSLTVYRCARRRICATATPNRKPLYSSSNAYVASVDEYGVITAKHHGTAMITASANGAKASCRVTVKSPTITLNKKTMTLYAGHSGLLTAKVSSGNRPTYTTSNGSVAIVNSSGTVTARKKGSCVIYVTEDGTTAKCYVTVK